MQSRKAQEQCIKARGAEQGSSAEALEISECFQILVCSFAWFHLACFFVIFFLVWCVWLFLCFLAVALALPFDGPVHLNVSLLASCFWVLLSFFGLQSLLLACLGLLVLLCVDLACFQSAEFCISRGLTLALSGFDSTNEFCFPMVTFENALRVLRR